MKGDCLYQNECPYIHELSDWEEREKENYFDQDAKEENCAICFSPIASTLLGTYSNCGH